MTHSQFNQYLNSGDFRRLFIDGLGWNNFPGSSGFSIAVGDDEYEMKTIAQRSGFQIIICETETIPASSLCKKIDTKLRRFANDYICIYCEPGTLHHLWVVPVKSVEKRELVCVEYTSLPQADFLYSKLQEFTFGIEEETLISDVKESVQRAFSINSEKITKDFYAGFKKEHAEFAKFISGVNDETDVKENKNKQWYTSVMLNRLMFCYFIQKKGFLNNDTNYLKNKLEWTKKARGENQFFGTFYKGFLSRMFHDGLNAPSRSRNEDFEDIYGRIPYLNGGMFDEHQIEKDYENLDIADGAFERLFDFFDKWEWHLDTRVTATGKDINPDVLGYIFEQYINDRAQMGAYYTKEDITEYIGKNCIIPFLFDKVSSTESEDFSPSGYIWTMLKGSGTKYLYTAAAKGWSPDWENKLPDSIKVGLDTDSPNLLERRSHWNENTSEEFALPTEIWRETIERLKHCDEIVENIKSGSIVHINDFITYNLDIRSFTYDILATTKNPALIKSFYEALQNVSILDPTCGSGAFLFAAMNILEPLYEVCIERMQEFNDNDSTFFTDELNEITDKYRSNIQYFIFKSIILRNLYGVDIMVEATEIAKLRLFLKMVAVVEVDKRADNLGLDPLPDIDFNIRCGNTLVGYATETQLNSDLDFDSDVFQRLANQELKDKLEKELTDVAETYEVFRLVQLERNYDMAVLKQAKKSLQEKLSSLNELLNKHQFAASGCEDYKSWITSHQPFNWFSEFYNIMHNGGFDVIIGNPPYVEYSQVRRFYTIVNISCLDSGNLYAYVIERTFSLMHTRSRNGMIIQMSAFCTPRMYSFQEQWFNHSSFASLAFFDDRPGKLFDNLEHIRVVIPIMEMGEPTKDCNTTSYNKFYTEYRPFLFDTLIYYKSNTSRKESSVLKINNNIANSIANKIWSKKHKISEYESPRVNDNYVYYGYGYGYFGKILNYKSYFNGEKIQVSTGDKYFYINNDYDKNIFVAIMNTSLFYWYYVNYSDGHNFTKFVIGSLPFEYQDDSSIISTTKELMANLKANCGLKIANYKSTGRVEYEEYYPKKSKNIIDKIDIQFAKHYGFSEEEIDFIINYDIKFRMGDTLNCTEES